MNQIQKVKPLFRWVGGKQRLVKIFKNWVPELDNKTTYFEPFFGGGSLFFELLPRNAIISDLNRDLIESYKWIQKNPETVWKLLSDLSRNTGGADYYQDREIFNNCNWTCSKAALFIYLNRTCYNGIWRVNLQGKFNVPYGKMEQPKFPNLDDLNRVSRALKGAQLQAIDFAKVLQIVKRKDFVYLDPPYIPLNGTAFFTHYTKHRFPKQEHLRVLEEFLRLTRIGARVLLTVSSCDFTRRVYKEFEIAELETYRWIAAFGRRYRVTDLVVRNYQ